MEFVLAEFGTTGSVTADNKLIIKGRFQSKQLENVLRKYIGMRIILSSGLFCCRCCGAYADLFILFVQLSTLSAVRARVQTQNSPKKID